VRQMDRRTDEHTDVWTLFSIIYGAHECLHDGTTCKPNPENDSPVFGLFALAYVSACCGHGYMLLSIEFEL
jgi:hypothetical protein